MAVGREQRVQQQRRQPSAAQPDGPPCPRADEWNAHDYAEILINSSLDMIIGVDARRRIMTFNPAAERTFGYRREEVLGKSVDLLYADAAEGVQVHGQAFARGGFTGEIRNRRKNGEIFYSYLSASVMRDPQGQVVGVMGISRDITEQKQTEAKLAELVTQLQQSRDDLISLLNLLRLGTAMTDEAGRITFLSQTAQQLLGLAHESAMGKRWDEVWPFDAQDTARLQAMAQKPPQRRTRVLVRSETPDGRHYWIEIDIQDDPRNPQRKIFFLYDVSEVHDLRRLLDEKAQFYDLVGKSRPMALVYQQIRDVARVDSTVLIEGETGTGKELVARAIHAASHRRDKPFVTVNCAGLTESLVASQLFGHKRGAFTGAIADHQGLFEAANGGTLFLDEIGDLPLPIQTSLLRVLQEREIVRLGESRARKIDVRILAATHRQLSEEVAKGNFRADLLYRIRVARIHLAPLRERREDIPLLASTFLRQCRAATGKPVQEISNEAMGLLLAYPWPGNVRELKNAVEFAVIRCRDTVIRPEDLPPEILDLQPERVSRGESPSVDEKTRLLSALATAKGNRTVAARLLGVSRATFYRRLAAFAVSP
ncbi:MAG: sigma 54-interacting transcriptional regulator [Candidatus Binatia bacterium]|nr:sigma 54-interacting transcriptional regulator [Candidatus Binatia bacterium]